MMKNHFSISHMDFCFSLNFLLEHMNFKIWCIVDIYLHQMYLAFILYLLS
jgi:hypothetical protein